MKAKIENIRRTMIEMVERAGKGHLGTSLSSLEAIVAIRSIMRPNDIFISSKGHDAVAQYATLAEFGILDRNRLSTFRMPGGLPGHPTVDVPGISANTGSLGMGLSKALGFALGQDRTVYVLLGDGEMMEGQNWEAALAISKSGVKNIVALVDCNRFSQDGEASLEPIDIQFMFIAAGWRTSSVVDGNNLEFVGNALKDACGLGKPWAIILNTIKGNGLAFADTVESHFGPPGAVYPVHPLYKAFGEAVDAEMDQDEKVILVGADTLRDLQCYDLRNKYPGRVFDFGIAEQNAVSFASARALMGQKPIVATYACFLRRAFEQIYNQTTEGTQVVYVGTMAGRLDPSGPGISHQSLDDAEYMGGIMDYYVWAGRAVRAARLLHYALGCGQSSYLRLEHMTND